jgi:hypothetical protein
VNFYSYLGGQADFVLSNFVPFVDFPHLFLLFGAFAFLQKRTLGMGERREFLLFSVLGEYFSDPMGKFRQRGLFCPSRVHSNRTGD